MQDQFFVKGNYIGLLIGIGMLIIGFIALSRPPVNGFWTMNFAPIILTLAYCVVLPVAILWKQKEKGKEKE